jgi:hypothetical protein
MIETHHSSDDDTPTWSSRKAILSFWGVTCIALRWQNVPPIVVYSTHTNKDIFFYICRTKTIMVGCVCATSMSDYAMLVWKIFYNLCWFEKLKKKSTHCRSPNNALFARIVLFL